MIEQLHAMPHVDINQLACNKLDELLTRCTINLVTQLTGISRPTLYRWLDTARPYEDMNHRDSAWFIIMCETSPRIKMLMDRPPLSHPRLAKRILDDAETNDDT